MKKHDELVEEIERVLVDHIFIFVLGWEHRNDMGRITDIDNAKDLRQFFYEGGIDFFTRRHIQQVARKMIDLVLQAEGATQWPGMMS